MKKTLAIFLMVVMAISMSVTAFAAPDNFVVSPSVNVAPQLINFTPADDDCTAELIVTPYSERDNLPENFKELIEGMYKDISSADDFAKLLEGLGIKGDDLAVSDLFNIHSVGCDNHEGHYDYDITLSAKTLDRFEALVHKNPDGDWELINGAQVVNDGQYLKFTFTSEGPLAIIVNTGDSKGDQSIGTGDANDGKPSDSDDANDGKPSDNNGVNTGNGANDSNVTTKEPDKATQTGDISVVLTAVMAVCALAIVVVTSKSKKQGI